MRKILMKLETRYLKRALIISLLLDMLCVKYLSNLTVTVNWLSPVFGIVDLTLASILFFRITNETPAYIPKEFFIKKSFLCFNILHTFNIEIDLNYLENLIRNLILLLLSSIGLISILSLICDFL